MVGHVAPEAYDGGPIALVEEGDSITIDAKTRTIELNISTREMATRKRAWEQPKPRYTKGVLGKYIRTVAPANRGAITDGTDE